MFWKRENRQKTHHKVIIKTQSYDTLTYIIGILLGALITSTILYILKLHQKTRLQDDLIKKQHELIEALTMAAFGEKIKAKIKQMEEEEKNKPCFDPGNTCDCSGPKAEA